MSARQLTSLEWHRLRLDRSVNLSQGYAWEYGLTLTLGNGGFDEFEFVVGELPFAMFSLVASTTGSRGVLIEMFVGGTVGQGLTLPDQFPLNHSASKPNPMARATFPAAVSVEGTKIGETIIGDASRGGDSVEGLVSIFAADTQYYIRMTNTDTQSADIDLQLAGGGVTPVPPGL